MGAIFTGIRIGLMKGNVPSDAPARYGLHFRTAKLACDLLSAPMAVAAVLAAPLVLLVVCGCRLATGRLDAD